MLVVNLSSSVVKLMQEAIEQDEELTLPENKLLIDAIAEAAQAGEPLQVSQPE